MNTMTLWAVLGLMVRRDRVRSTVWITLLALFILTTVTGMAKLLPTQAERDAFAAGVLLNPVQLAYLGPVFVNSVAGLTAWRTSIFAIFVGLFALLTLTRHTRALEENGELELMLAQPIGRMGAWRIAIGWSMVTLLVLGCAYAVVMVIQQAPLADALLYGWSFTLDGWMMIGVTAICAQLSSSTRTVHTWAGVVMGLGYFCDANGRLNDNWLVWVSPVGWVQRTQPFAHNYWWVLGVGIVATGILVCISDLLMQRREYGSGLMSPRRGASHANGLLLGPWRFWGYQLRSMMLLWWVGALFLAVITTGLAQSIQTQFQSSPQLVAVLKMLGGSDQLMQAYLSFMAFIMAIFAMSAGIQVILTIRTHEAQGLLDTWLAGAWSRRLLYVVGLGWALIVASGVMYIYAVVIGVLADQTVLTISQSLWASTVIWPVIALTVALSAGLLVWVPRVLPVIWLWVVANGAIAVFNDLWKLPDSVLQWLPLVYSPHVLIGQAVTSYSWVVLAVAIGLSIAAGWGWQRRDMGR